MAAATDEQVLGKYVLATGEAAVRRLQMLHEVYGRGTREFLRRAGLTAGMRVADLGCGVGKVSADLARMVGPQGHVVGIDMSAEQLVEAAALMTQEGLSNVSFVRASATSTALPAGSFDLVYCRYLLLHLIHPAEGVGEMLRLLKPGGIIACEDGDLPSAESVPPSVLDIFSRLYAQLGPLRKVDYGLARHLYQLVRTAGFPLPEITFNKPAYARGELKRLLELSVAEAGPGFVHAGLISQTDLETAIQAMALGSMPAA